MWMMLFLISLIVEAEGCETIETVVSGNSMQGILFNGQKITVYTPACGAFERYDHLLFTHEDTPNAVIKQLWGLPGDVVKVKRNGTFTVNDVVALTPFKRPYVLNGSAKKRIRKLQSKPLDGYLVLGHPGIEMGPTGSLDSARIGLLTKEQIIGFVKQEEPFKEK